MPKEAEYSTRTRILRILRAILEQPYRYTRHQLAENYSVSPDTISGDFEAMANAEFTLRADERYRYAFVVDKPLRQLKDLLHFSEEDQSLLYQAIDNLPTTTERHQKLKAKLGSLYDYGRLGHSYLRKPYLTKVDLLEQARKEKKQVLLENYHSSNSSSISNRQVEPFHISPAEDMLHAFDIEKRLVRHFRLSRFTRAQLLEAPWQYESHHNIMLTDPFRIVGNDQVMVHLRLSVGAFNELTERYPLTRSYILETSDPQVFDFQCGVNRQFLGLSNFILGFYHLDIEVVAPDSLREHLRSEVAKMNF